MVAGLDKIAASFSLYGWRPRLAVLLALLVVLWLLCVDCEREDVRNHLQDSTACLDPSNVCITSILPNAAEPQQREWTSRSMNVSLLEGVHKGRKAYALWDMSNRTIRLKYVEDGQIEVHEMSDEAFARGQEQMTHATGLVPFDEITDLPKGSIWERISDPNATALIPQTQAYDLVWTTPVPTVPPTRQTERWRFFVDPQTHLPARVEMYSQSPAEPRPTLYKTLVMSYPTDLEVRVLVQTLFPDTQ